MKRIYTGTKTTNTATNNIICKQSKQIRNKKSPHQQDIPKTIQKQNIYKPLIISQKSILHKQNNTYSKEIRHITGPHKQDNTETKHTYTYAHAHT